MAADPLAYCPTCKIVFPVTRPEGGTVVFKNSTTSCQKGHFARILNKPQQAFESDLQATLGVHRQAVRQPVLELWERLRRREIEPEQAQADAERARRGLGALFNPANFSDPVRKAILEALIADLAAMPEPVPPPSPQIVVDNSAPAPQVEPPNDLLVEPSGDLLGRPKISNRAFQRRLRHQHRLQMNPRGR
jgi:hypothetical protein